MYNLDYIRIIDCRLKFKNCIHQKIVLYWIKKMQVINNYLKSKSKNH